MRLLAVALLIFVCQTTTARDNGVALTPPMGWLAWERFRCTVNCTSDPDTCLSEKLIKEMADIMGSKEWKEAGYEYINIDDCWAERARDSNEKLVPDKSRFPSGMKALADYVHSKGLKIGIYNDMGTQTCGGYPGECRDEKCTLPGYMDIDAQTYAAWGIDSLKMDGCNSAPHDPDTLNPGYIYLGLNKTGRPILYSCSWPDYIRSAGYPMNLSTIVAPNCNIWRMYNDIQDSWILLPQLSIGLATTRYAGPHRGFRSRHFNDPDMLIINDFFFELRAVKSSVCVCRSWQHLC